MQGTVSSTAKPTEIKHLSSYQIPCNNKWPMGCEVQLAVQPYKQFLWWFINPVN